MEESERGANAPGRDRGRVGGLSRGGERHRMVAMAAFASVYLLEK